ncbi:hypothetical protein [Natrinema caseinilyticum]|uniref:hypothetical protein n=1 Tax=Natrinema caseinilyticum TaxID=2961570 RepID=UPI0020C23F20|nr:hypothetical protein [Natrinema caseinilyticum]
MSYGHNQRAVAREDRREFLKVLGVTGTAAAGGATLSEVRDGMTAGTAEKLAPIGEAIEADLTGSLDAGLLATHGAAVADAVSSLPETIEYGLPRAEPRTEFASIAEAGWPIYDHLDEAGFFESTTDHLPRFSPESLETAVATFVESEQSVDPLTALGFDSGKGVSLLATVIANAEELSTHHWVATDEIPRERIEFGDAIPPMTMGAAGGVLLWLDDLDGHLWRQANLLTEEIHANAVWHGQSMGAGFFLMAEGAKAIATEDASLSDGELGGLLSTGFAVQAIAQGLLPQDVYWVTDEMRGETAVDLETITE